MISWMRIVKSVKLMNDDDDELGTVSLVEESILKRQ